MSGVNPATRRRSIGIFGGVVALWAVTGCADEAADAAGAEARAVLRDAAGQEVGHVEFTETDGATFVDVDLDVSDAAEVRFHGLHIHANDDPANGEGCVADRSQPAASWFVAVDGHLAKGDETHGRHVGDLPSVLVNPDGSAAGSVAYQGLDVDELAGRAVVLHAGPDNFANVPVGAGPDQYTPNTPAATDKTRSTGNAGDRLACGVIER